MNLIIRPMAFFAADNKFVGVKRLYYICDAHYYEMRRHIFLEKRFVLYPLQKIANFKTTRIEAVEKTLMLVAYPLPDKGADIRDGVGVDCLSVVRRLAMPPVR